MQQHDHKQSAQKQVETKEDLKRRLVGGDFSGIQYNQLRWLKAMVPSQYLDAEELEQQIVFYSLDAIERFDPNRGVKFSTFLVTHLRMKCIGYQQYLWIRSSANSRCRTLPTYDCHSNGKRGKTPRFFSNETTTSQTPLALDPDSGVHIQEFTVRGDIAFESLAVKELLDSLSETARYYMVQLLGFDNQDMLAAAFRSTHFRSKVAKITGMTWEQVDVFAAEVRIKVEEHLEVR